MLAIIVIDKSSSIEIYHSLVQADDASLQEYNDRLFVGHY